ncbi:MAG TPA: hypothetical protein VMM81_00620 [Acidimicrobiia bacterium]|nr:hypothetical protein [Acidimicrobiia bacterium]
MRRIDTLIDQLTRLPGVDTADVVGDGETPQSVRVRLRSGADARAVGVEVQRLLASYGLRSRISNDEVVSVSEVAPAPTPTATPSGQIASVTVREAVDGTTVTVDAGGQTVTESSDGTRAGLARAAAVAVGRLLVGVPVGLLWFDTSEVDGEQVVSVLVERPDGARVAGAATVRGDVAAGVARAVAAALSS